MCVLSDYTIREGVDSAKPGDSCTNEVLTRGATYVGGANGTVVHDNYSILPVSGTYDDDMKCPFPSRVEAIQCKDNEYAEYNGITESDLKRVCTKWDWGPADGKWKENTYSDRPNPNSKFDCTSVNRPLMTGNRCNICPKGTITRTPKPSITFKGTIDNLKLTVNRASLTSSAQPERGDTITGNGIATDTYIIQYSQNQNTNTELVYWVNKPHNLKNITINSGRGTAYNTCECPPGTFSTDPMKFKCLPVPSPRDVVSNGLNTETGIYGTVGNNPVVKESYYCDYTVQNGKNNTCWNPAQLNNDVPTCPSGWDKYEYKYAKGKKKKYKCGCKYTVATGDSNRTKVETLYNTCVDKKIPIAYNFGRYKKDNTWKENVPKQKNQYPTLFKKKWSYRNNGAYPDTDPKNWP